MYENNITSLGLKLAGANGVQTINFRTEKRHKSVLSPSAQSTRPCVQGFDYVASYKQLRGIVDSLKNENSILHDLFLIMLESGCRVSEVLRLRFCDVFGINKVYIRASKGSSDRIVSVSGLVNKKILNRSDKDLIFNYFDRFFVYRFSRDYIINKMDSGLFFDKATKIFRYSLASAVYQETENLETVANLLGHKNVDNARYYIFQLKGPGSKFDGKKRKV